MLLLCLVQLFHIDQAVFDQAMAMMSTRYSARTADHSSFFTGTIPSWCKDFSLEHRDIDPDRADIIIGDTPAETLSVNGYFYNEGDIIIINDGVLKVQSADFNLAGDIIMTNQARAFIDSSAVSFLQAHIYHRIVYIVDSAYMVISNSNTNFSGFPFSISMANNARLDLDAVVNEDWITAGVVHNASVFLDNVSITGEWLFADESYGAFKHVNELLTWYFCEDSSFVDISFPDEDTIYAYYFDSTLSTISGIGYHVEIDSSTDCIWATIPLRGSDVTVRDSDLRVTGLMFEGPDTFSITGLVNGLFYDDYILPVQDRDYHLINTSVQTWNLYPDDTSYIELSSSIFGELCAFGNSSALVQNSFCDGTGGHIEASSQSFVIVFLSSIFADVITKDHGICLLGYCAMPWGNLWATGSSIMVLVNTQFPEDPVLSDTAIVFVAGIAGPSNAYTDDTVGIIGSAWIDKGPYNPLDFGFYRLFYRSLGQSTWISIGDTHFVEVRDDTLGYWNTTGLSPDIYEVRVVVKSSGEDSIEALKQVNLRPMGVRDILTGHIDPLSMNVIQIAPRIFYILSYDANPRMCIYDIIGRAVCDISVPELYWTAPASGVFFVYDKKTAHTHKIIAY
jgi:hypothetical protein